jgi:hypothetical protein
MSDFSVRSDNVDVEQIMRQIRARIREKRGVDYTEEEIRELANVKLEKFIDPKGVRSNLLEEYRRVSTPEPPAPNYAFGEDTLYETHRGPIRWLRALFRPLLKLLFNPNPLIQALHIQSELNQKNAERNARREQLDALHYEVIHNLVVELTRTGVELKSVKMRLESMASRLDFDERRARALEGVVQYRPGAVPPLQPPTGQDQPRRDQQPRRDPGGRSQGQRDHRDQRGPRPPMPAAPPQPGVTGGGPMTEPPAAGSPNALDNDGNERRARRRRRRGRRRPGEDRPAYAGNGTSAGFGAAGPAAGSGTSAGFGAASPGGTESSGGFGAAGSAADTGTSTGVGAVSPGGTESSGGFSPSSPGDENSTGTPRTSAPEPRSSTFESADTPARPPSSDADPTSE